MLIVNGTIGGQTYDNSIVKAETLMNAFSIPPLDGRPATFRLIEGYGLMRRDRSNPGEMLIAPAKRINPEFTVSTSNGTISIRYATNRTAIPGGGGTYRFTPKKMEFINGSSHFYFDEKRIEEYVWAYLHPNNRKSPFSRNPKYEYFSAEADAIKSMEMLTKQNELIQTIFAMPDAELRLRSAGLVYHVGPKTVQFPGSANLQIAVIKQRLIEALTRDGRHFVDAWASSETSVLGVVRMAESLGIIEQVQMSGGVEWRYTANYGGARIAFATSQQNPLQVLVGEVTSMYATYYPKIKALIEVAGGGVAAQVVDKPARTPEPIPEMPLVDRLMEADLISFERTTGTVHQIKANGNLGAPIIKVENKGAWKSELKQYFETEDGQKIVTDLEAILSKKK